MVKSAVICFNKVPSVTAGNPLRVVVVSVLACLLLWLVWSRSRRHPNWNKLPPGPKGLPLVGNLPFLSKCFDPAQCKAWAEKYGPVFRINMGPGNVVILNDFNSIKKYFCKPEVLYRPSDWILTHSGVVGVATINGKAWVDNRRFCMQVLRDLGVGKKSMEKHIQEESQYLVEKIAETKGRATDAQEFLTPSVSNNITALVFGRRYPYENASRKYMDDRLERVIKVLSRGSIVGILPAWVFSILVRIPSTTSNVIKTIADDLLGYASQKVKEHLESSELRAERDFIDRYLSKIKENDWNPDSSFTMNHLLGNVLSFFIAASNTVRTSVQWHMLCLAANRDTLQLRIQREIDEAVGKDRAPTWEDRDKMPFTVASIWEMYRWRTDSPFGVPRAAGEDTFFGEYFIPKGTIVMANFRAVHSNPKLWKNPERFDPTRFLTEGGAHLAPKPDYLIPFSVGKRMCPGETLTTVEIFLYLTSLLQRFDILPEEGKAINLAPVSVTFNIPFPQKLRFVPRCKD
ncbi:cytochrome P450 2C28 [Ixodes scapularis]|uniref:cytochrome P450 2C28 n=1 Tax=Ixodes scapularis TaxID=6945 RepID=UPI001C38BF74|nr:cytochrome P450 2C28 [Ixodes scapularis]